MLQDFYKRLGDLPQASYYSDKLRLRPNYLIYTLGAKLTLEQREYFSISLVPWAEYKNCSRFEAMVSFLHSVQGGIYLPRIFSNMEEKSELVSLFLLDPHLIDEFEQLVTTERQGVLIRRPILASQDFKDTIKLSV